MKPPKYFQCWVEGLPKTAAKQKANFKTGRMFPDDKGGHKKAWAEKIREIAYIKLWELAKGRPGLMFPQYVPVLLELDFFLPKPKSSKHKYPVVKPDLSNFAYLVENALSGLVYYDDAQVVRLVNQELYAAIGCDDSSGVGITVKERL